MKTHKILYEHTGEVSSTAKDPKAMWTNQVDLEETTGAILSNDDWRGVTVQKYAIHTVTLPDWLEPTDWIRNAIYWKYTWAFGTNPEWSEEWQRYIFTLTSWERLAVVKLLKTKKFRSEFRQSLRNRLEKWLATPESERQYNSPFSRKQWNCLYNSYIAREADQLDNGIYRARGRLTGVPQS